MSSPPIQEMTLTQICTELHDNGDRRLDCCLKKGPLPCSKRISDDLPYYCLICADVVCLSTCITCCVTNPCVVAPAGCLCLCSCAGGGAVSYPLWMSSLLLSDNKCCALILKNRLEKARKTSMYRASISDKIEVLRDMYGDSEAYTFEQNLNNATTPEQVLKLNDDVTQYMASL